MTGKKQAVDNKKAGRVKKILIIILIVLLSLILIAGIVVLGLRAVGKTKVTQAIEGTGEGMVGIGSTISANTLPDDVPEDENLIMYNGTVYRPNEDIITILVMGIDKHELNETDEDSDEETDLYSGGQADGLFLVVINPHTECIDIVAINRNTMTDVDVWDINGDYMGMYPKQICLQHGYGDGGTESCERQVRTVSRLFHGITINAYAAITMDAIPDMNDAIGGVTVEVLDDIDYPEYGVKFNQGDVVTLMGNQAYAYVRFRYEDEFDSASLRLARQKQYVIKYISVAKSMVMKDISVATNLYSIVQDYMVTDIDLSSFTYLATEYAGYKFDASAMYSLQGETIQGTKFEEFYADEDALEELIVQLYYEPAY